MTRNTNGRKKQQSRAVGPQAFVYGVVACSVLGATVVVSSLQIAIAVLAALILVAGYYFVSTKPDLSRRLRRATGGNLQTAVFGAVVIVTISFIGARFLPASFAWHPEGTITKTVKNVTAGGPEVDANDASSALQARPGDVLDYTVTVANTAGPADNNGNDMAYTVLVEDLPAGVELIDDPGVGSFSESLGTILPGNTVVRHYKVKVTANVVGDILHNKACFTANSVVKDNPQSGCDNAVVTITHSDPTPTAASDPTPTPTPTPNTSGSGGEQTPSPSPNPVAGTTTTDAPARLVNAGPGGVIIIALFGVLGGYIAHEVYRRTRQA